MRGRTCPDCGFDIGRDYDECPICTYNSFVVDGGRVTPLNSNPKKSSENTLQGFTKHTEIKMRRINVDKIVIKTPVLNNSFNRSLLFESQQCRMQIYLEHYRVYIEISDLNVNDLNLWYGIDAMACLFLKHCPVCGRMIFPEEFLSARS